MRRRELLRALPLVLAGACTSAAGQLGRGSARQGSEEGAARPAPRADGRPLADAERETLLAFAEVLVAGHPFSPAARGELLSHIGDRVRASEDALDLYRETTALLNRLAGAAFLTLPFRERVEFVTRHRLVPSRGQVQRPDDPAQPVRTRVAPDLIAGYYGSPRGWAVVGYGVFPGQCGDLLRYTRPEP